MLCKTDCLCLFFFTVTVIISCTVQCFPSCCPRGHVPVIKGLKHVQSFGLGTSSFRSPSHSPALSPQETLQESSGHPEISVADAAGFSLPIHLPERRGFLRQTILTWHTHPATATQSFVRTTRTELDYLLLDCSSACTASSGCTVRKPGNLPPDGNILAPPPQDTCPHFSTVYKQKITVCEPPITVPKPQIIVLQPQITVTEPQMTVSVFFLTVIRK